MKPQC